MKNSQHYLKSKLESFIEQFKHYELKLYHKQEVSPELRSQVELLVEKIQLECCHYEDQLLELDTHQLPESRIRHKTSILIESYEKLISQINQVLLKKENHRSRVESDQISFRKQQPARLKQIKGFIQELNNTWMLDLLNKNKKKKVENKPKQKPIKTTVSKQLSPDRRKLGMMYMQKQIKCLSTMAQNLQKTYEQHKHRNIEEQLLNLKDQQINLMKGYNEVKQTNNQLKQQFAELQHELQEVRRTTEMLHQRYFK